MRTPGLTIYDQYVFQLQPLELCFEDAHRPLDFFNTTLFIIYRVYSVTAYNLKSKDMQL